MAKKKRQPPKKGPKGAPPPKGRKAPKASGMKLPDRRAMEAIMRAFLDELEGEPIPETPLDQAQEVAYQAFEEPNPKKRVELARKALEISPDCADAYVLLGEQAQGRKEALEYFEKAVAAGERALGPEYFREAVGDFWLLLETRPYMRARERLAHTLWTLGRREEAAGHLQEMLRLNPNDNQGVRYVLASWLLALDRDDDLARLLEQYQEDGSATWAYTRALLAFRREGDTPESRQLLKVAQRSNKHVPAYLLGEKPMPIEPPDYYGMGDENEAIIYAAGALSAWKSMPGAITWLREVLPAARPKKARPKGPKPRGPTAAVRQRLGRLPQEFDVWQADCCQLPHWVETDTGRVRPWIILVTSRTYGLILGNAMTEEPPPAERLWDVLAAAMQSPAAGDPHRPIEIQVRPDERWQALRPHLEEIGITSTETDDLDHLELVYDDLTRFLSRDEPPGLLEMPGMTPERLGSFYQAAASFYRKAPWKSLGYEEAIRVEADKYESGPWYAVVMGQSGLTLGLALYEDLDLLRRMWAGELSEEENARQTVALSITFDPEIHVSAADLAAIQRHGWEVAGPEAFPSVFRKERGMSLRPPLAWELELLEGCLRAIPEFVARYRPGDTAPHSLLVPVASGELRLTLSWVDEG
ncbi:MAG: hypothetical protein IRY99_17275 [Isosphaeraceae bacterium]|nr:hypothetical protein [Isosphaeraceae bacterium]